jgi:hypothetical protein
MKLTWPNLWFPPINLWNVPAIFKRRERRDMTLTTTDINERLARLDEVSLLEILDISSQDLVDRFQDVIEERRHNFEEDLEDE